MEVSNAPSRDAVKATVKEYILREFLPGASESELTDDTPLVSGAILDSLATVQLVAFLEERYDIDVRAHEASIDHLNRLDDIATLVMSKLS